MSINKLIVLGAAFILASLIGSTPAAAVCTTDLHTSDCDGDTILDVCDPDTPNFADLDCNFDGIPNKCDANDGNISLYYPDLDCDGDTVVNADDLLCPDTVLGEDLVVGACTISGLDTILPTGCSLTESITDSLAECADGVRNHGKYVSCVAHLTNGLKKQKFITGAQKGQIQSCAAQTDIGKKPHP
jgi:hypothetical protein